MSQAALIRAIAEMLSCNPRYDPVAAIVDGEIARGFTVIRPGDKEWFSLTDWMPESIASIQKNRVRLVLLHARESGKGALTQMLRKIEASGLDAAIIDPTPQFAETLKRRGWNGKKTGRSFETYETVWQKRK